ncbi:hypothetical protein J6590_035160 [Homalodisca vitripennis]|nr:hypothetical protein J6590_035160 [Homalodisca vitripennis]
MLWFALATEILTDLANDLEGTQLRNLESKIVLPSATTVTAKRPVLWRKRIRETNGDTNSWSVTVCGQGQGHKSGRGDSSTDVARAQNHHAPSYQGWSPIREASETTCRYQVYLKPVLVLSGPDTIRKLLLQLYWLQQALVSGHFTNNKRLSDDIPVVPNLFPDMVQEGGWSADMRIVYPIKTLLTSTAGNVFDIDIRLLPTPLLKNS